MAYELECLWQAYDLLEYPSGRDAEDLLSTKSDVLHAVSKDLR